ncbi:MAG: CbiX/SirB N-terminal domain-containing protein [Phormidesmis sp.]
MVASTAYLLISHGSRDPRPQEAMNRLSELVRRRLEAMPQVPALSKKTSESSAPALNDRIFLNRHEAQDQKQVASKDRQIGGRTTLLTRPQVETAPTNSAKVMVGTACLELSPIPLSEQIYEFGRRLQDAGVEELKLLPMFLMAGVHVMEDIPKEVAIAQQLLKGSSLTLTLCSHLGSHADVAQVLANRLASVPAGGSLLVSHGSRRPKGNCAVMALANQLDTTVAYWSTPPDIETQVIDLMQKGFQRLTILPYFLFAGGITDAITHRTEELAERFPRVKFRLLPTLGATDEVADLVLKLAHS